MIKQITRLLAVGCLLIAAMSAQAAVMYPITYALSFDDGLGNTLEGTITTDGTVGDIMEANILDISFTASGVPAFSFSGFTALQCFGACFTATLDALMFDFGANDGSVLANFFASGFGGGVTLLDAPSSNVTWQCAEFPTSVCTTQGTVVLNVGDQKLNFAAVPEPATALLVLSALAFPLWSAARRSDR